MHHSVVMAIYMKELHQRSMTTLLVVAGVLPCDFSTLVVQGGLKYLLGDLPDRKTVALRVSQESVNGLFFFNAIRQVLDF